MNIYFGCFNLEMPSGSKKEFLHLPYSAGTIWAYANTDERIKNNYQLKEMYIKKMPIDELVAELVDPKVFAFSSYVWNMQYNLALADQVKKKFPYCKIIFGGPSVTINNKNFLRDHPFIDYAIYLEGEISFQNVLLDVLGHHVEFNGVATRTKRPIGIPKRIENLETIPSPYTAGYFDHVIKRHKSDNVLFNAIIETNRGCPFACTFCDWGQTTNSKIKKFEMCRVHEDLLWCAKNDIDLVNNADANFGAFKERDMSIAKYFVKLNKEYGAPRQWNCSWHKNQTQEIVAIAEEFVKNGLIRKYGVSFQSLEPDVLTAIKRKNITHKQFDKISTMAKKYNIPIGVDIMVPLPNQTAQSHLDDLDFLFERDIFPSLTPTTVLPGAEMHDEDYRKKWGLETQILKMNTTGKFVWEKEEWLIGTKHMTKKECEEILITGWVLSAFQMSGFTDLISKYYFKKFQIKFTKFHELFWKYFTNTQFYTSKWIEPLQNHLEKKTSTRLFGGIENIPMHDDLGLDNRDKFFTELKQFCIDKLPYTEDLDDLILLQYNNQNYEGIKKEIVINCQSNLLDYINGQSTHKTIPTAYKIRFENYKTNIASIGIALSNGRFSKTWQNKISRLPAYSVV